MNATAYGLRGLSVIMVLLLSIRQVVVFCKEPGNSADHALEELALLCFPGTVRAEKLFVTGRVLKQ